MESAGERLRRVRLERGLDLHDIADELRIGARYLEAIENDDIKVLPGGFFSKSFYRQYGNYLGVNDQQFSAAVEILFAEPDLTSSGQRTPSQAVAGIAPIPAPSYRARSRRPWLSFAVLLAVVAVCSGLYALWQRLQQPAPNERAVASVAAQQAESTAPAGAPPQAVEPLFPAKAVTPMVLNLSATERVWLSVTSQGKVLFSGVLEPSQSKALDTGDNARILIGNAGGLDVQWKGRSLGPIGPRGQVRVLVLRPEGFEILPPKKEAEPEL